MPLGELLRVCVCLITYLYSMGREFSTHGAPSHDGCKRVCACECLRASVRVWVCLCSETIASLSPRTDQEQPLRDTTVKKSQECVCGEAWGRGSVGDSLFHSGPIPSPLSSATWAAQLHSLSVTSVSLRTKLSCSLVAEVARGPASSWGTG